MKTNSVTKILIINPYGIGDVLFTTPVMSNLRRLYPEADIAYLANRRTADFLKSNPDIDQVFVYERDEFVALYRQDPLKFIQKWFGLLSGIKQQALSKGNNFILSKIAYLGGWLFKAVS